MKSYLLKFCISIAFLFLKINSLPAFSLTIDTAQINLENKKARLFILDGNIDSANYYSQLSLQNSLSSHYLKGEADALYIVAKTTIQQHNNFLAMKKFIDAEKIYEKIHDSVGLANCNLQLGIINYYEKKYDKALSYYQLALQDFLSIRNNPLIAQCLYLKGLCLIELVKYNEAGNDLHEALIKMKATNNSQGENECCTGLAKLYYCKNDFKNSLTYYKLALHYFEKTNNGEGIIIAQNGIGKNFIQTNQLDSAQYYLTKAYSLSIKLNKIDGKLESSKQLTEYYSKKNDFKNAFQFQNQYYNIRDSLFNELTSNRISTLQNEVDLTHKQNEIDELNSEKKVYKIWMYLFGLGLILIVIILFLEWRSAKLKQSFNKKLLETNAELNHVITELKSTQIQLIQSEKLASLGQLTAGIAHEINNPINFVTSSVGSLKRDFDDVLLVLNTYKSDPEKVEALKKEIDFEFTIEEIQQLILGINEGADRTSEIVKGLRNFSRVDEGEFKIVDIHEGLNSTILLLHPKFGDKIKIEKNYGSLPMINCFPGQINQVFMNIMSNAADAIENEHGKIIITTSVNINNVVISIKDNGKGMSDETKQKIFDPFFTTKDVGKGTGLGMSIAYGIIEKHNGSIDINSTIGIGTEFIITLPINNYTSQ